MFITQAELCCLFCACVCVIDVWDYKHQLHVSHFKPKCRTEEVSQEQSMSDENLGKCISSSAGDKGL